MVELYGAVFAVVLIAGFALIVVGWRGVEEPAQRQRREVQLQVSWKQLVAMIVIPGLIWWWSGWPMAAVGAAAMLWMGPQFAQARKDRQAAVVKAEAIAAWAEMLRDTISTGSGVQRAIQVTAPLAPQPIRREVGTLAARADTMPLPAALWLFATDVGDASADVVVASLAIAVEQQARNLTGLLSEIAVTARQHVAMRERVEVGRARTYSAAKSMMMISLGIAAVMIVARPKFLEPYDTLAGQAMMGLIAAIFVAAVWSLIAMSKPAESVRLVEVAS